MILREIETNCRETEGKNIQRIGRRPLPLDKNDMPETPRKWKGALYVDDEMPHECERAGERQEGHEDLWANTLINDVDWPVGLISSESTGMQMTSGATFVETRKRHKQNRIGQYELQIEIMCWFGDFDGVALWLDLKQ